MKIRPHIHISGKFFVLVSLFIAGMLSGRDILLLCCKQFPHLYSVVDVPRQTFEEIYCYMPMLNNFSVSEIFSFLSMHPSQMSVYITMIVEGVIFKWLCFSNVDVFLFVSHLVFPLCSFWLVFAIYKRYLSRWWALLLAFWGITFYCNFSLFGYLFGVIDNPADIINSASLSPLEIIRTPFPAFSFFAFILCFYISSRSYKISQRKYALLTILWSLNAYIYMVNFIAGVMFWFMFIVFSKYIAEKGFNVKAIAKTVFINAAIMTIIVSPLFMKFFFNTTTDMQIIANLGMYHRDVGLVFGHWGFFVTYLLPIILVILVIRIYCADYYELWYRFMPVIIMVGVELVMLNLHLLLGSFFHTQLFSIRIGNYFLLYLYFVPIIYFFSVPFKSLFHNTDRQKFATVFHDFFRNYVIKYKIAISLVCIVLTSVHIVCSNMRYYEHNKCSQLRMKSVYDNFGSLTSVGDGTVISQDLPVNLLLPALSVNGSLFINSFNNLVQTDQILDRLTLYARIFNWSSDRFLAFMMPGKTIDGLYTENDFVFSQKVFESGFGYWLAWHSRKMNIDQLEKYRQDLLIRFNNINIKEAVKKYDLTVIQAFDEINPAVPVMLLKNENGMNLYLVDKENKS
ncbi:MAG: hypothetical protein K8R02_01725 [Anaerohalosphaeraceae bacterium]|nr:hypothetical protein [Anaerohalosphaeraceae bacterium]